MAHVAAVVQGPLPGGVGRVGVPHLRGYRGRAACVRPERDRRRRPRATRAYIDELLPDIMEGHIQPGRVFDRTVDLDGVPDGYGAMNVREALKC